MQGNKKDNNKYIRYIDLAFQYHIAAVSLWNSIFEASYLYNPCMFLARHTVELLIKGLIYRDCENVSTIRIKDDKRKKTISNSHNLSALWLCYLAEKRSCLFPTQKEFERIGKMIKSITNIDIDSTKYRYPETKNPISSLKLEPIKIDKNTSASPELSKRVPLLAISADSTNIIKFGKVALKHGYEAFDLIHDLFQLVDNNELQGE